MCELNSKKPHDEAARSSPFSNLSKLIPGISDVLSAFAVENREWISKAVESEAVQEVWRAGDFHLLESMAKPTGSIENYASLLDIALNAWPSAQKSSPQVTKLYSVLSNSSLLDRRIERQLDRLKTNLPEIFTANQRRLAAITGIDINPAWQKEAEQEIIQQVTKNADVRYLSKSALHYLYTLLIIISFLANYLALQNGARSELCFFVPKLAPALSANKVGKAVRAFMCDADLPLESLANLRIVKGVGVRLRTEPHMKAPLVQVTLQDRDLLEILDGSNRDWLYVSILQEKGVTGWVSRRYTHALTR